MTTQLNQTQILSAIQEKNKMHFDHKLPSASMQSSSRRSAISDGFSQSASQQFSAGKHVLRPCIYIALRCSRCGPVRQALPELPTQDVIACPECSRECGFGLLGSGVTSRNIPFHQVHIIEPTRWDPQVDGETNSS